MITNSARLAQSTAVVPANDGTTVSCAAGVCRLNRHCERSEAIQAASAAALWIASSLRSSQ